MRTESVRKSDLENKYVFWDIDGTLAPYRFNDHVSDPEGTNNGMSLKEISEHIFLTRKPSQHMMKIVYNCGWINIFQLLDDKIEYLLLKIFQKPIALSNIVQDIELT